MSHPDFAVLKQEVLGALQTAQDAVARAGTPEALVEAAKLLAGLPGLVKAMVLEPGAMGRVQVQMEGAKRRLSSLTTKRPSYSDLPPAARHFREAGDAAAKALKPKCTCGARGCPPGQPHQESCPVAKYLEDVRRVR